jgi:myosin-5
MHGIFVSKIAHRFDTFARFFRPTDVKGAAGIQKGATQVFFRQHAFDNVEKLRSKVMSKSSVKIQAAARRFISRCRYARTLGFTVKVQACARRFIARKILIAVREKRFATRIQTFVRLSLARRKFVARKAAALLVQRIFRGYIARKNYKVLYEFFKEEEKKRKAAIVIQCMYRITVARKRAKELKATSKKAPKLEGKALRTAIKSDRAAAIAKQAAQDRRKEVDNLTSRLGDAKVSAEKAGEALEELETVKAELEAVRAELEMVKEEAAASKDRADKLQEENDILNEKLESGDFIVGEPYSRILYNGHPDLEEVDKQMFGMVSHSKKSKQDVKKLIEFLAILK